MPRKRGKLRQSPKPPAAAPAWHPAPKPGSTYYVRWKGEGEPVPLRPVRHTWEDVDRLRGVALNGLAEGDADWLADLAERLRRMLPKQPPSVAQLRAIRLGLGRLLRLQNRDGSRRPLPLEDFARLLRIGTRQAARYMNGVTPVTDEEQLKRLRAMRRAMDNPDPLQAEGWLRKQLVRPVPLRTRRERRAHQGAEAVEPQKGAPPKTRALTRPEPRCPFCGRCVEEDRCIERRIAEALAGGDANLDTPPPAH